MSFHPSDDSRQSRPLPPGTTLCDARYHLEEVLAEGGMSVVYRGRMPALGDRRVAVKELRLPEHERSARSAAMEQFKREAELLAHLDHPGLVGIIDWFEDRGRAFLVMPYIDGRTLQQVIEESLVGLPVETAIRLAGDLCEVLTYLHEQRPPVLFRDLKPSNVMIDGAGRLRLIDFGIAHTFDPEEGTNTFLHGAGTMGYSSVEQLGWGSASTDARSDIYSLGATMFSMLTHMLPPSAVAVLQKDEVLSPPSFYNHRVPAWLDRLVVRMMSPRKEDRPQSARAVQEALRQGGHEAGSGPPDETEAWEVGSPPAHVQVLRLPERSVVVVHPLNVASQTIGRGDQCDIHVDDRAVSRVHARLEQRADGCWLVPLSATNPTVVNGRRIEVDHLLADGDEVMVSPRTLLLFRQRAQ